MKTGVLLAGFLLAFAVAANAQGLVGKLKQKAAEAAEKALDKKVDEKVDEKIGGDNSGGADQNSDSGSYGDAGDGSSNAGRPANRKGGGLVSTPPDVNSNLSEAESAYKSRKYGQARYAVQQAMLGVEMQIGEKVLKSLPESVDKLPKVEGEDQLTASGHGWAGLTIRRVYREGDRQVTATVANNSGLIAGLNMMMANAGYAQSTGGQQNWKQTKVKGHKAVIEYDEYSGYKLSVPLGQSSLVFWEGINIESEQEMMKIAESFDIDSLKDLLGEQ